MEKFLIAHIGHTTKWCGHITWWKPDSCGYTVCIDKAGIYMEGEARSICRSGLCIAVPKADVQKLARSTPFYRAGGGILARMYDGGPHSVVENSREGWKALMAARLDCGKADKPTPISKAKAGAIYLDGAILETIQAQRAAQAAQGGEHDGAK